MHLHTENLHILKMGIALTHINTGRCKWGPIPTKINWVEVHLKFSLLHKQCNLLLFGLWFGHLALISNTRHEGSGDYPSLKNSKYH